MVQYHQFNANNGDPAAQATMGHVHLRGLHGLPVDPARAHQLFDRAAEQGNAAALAYLGLMYDTGEGVPSNLTKAQEYYEKAAEKVVLRSGCCCVAPIGSC